MSELTRDLVDDINKWTRSNTYELPFADLFKGNDTREIVPLKSDPIALSILNKIQQEGLTVDLEKGTVSNGQRIVRLGKYILNKKSPFDDSEKQWWNKQGDALEALENAKRANEYAIVISRNPIDIARMSDHDGWSSCHSQGGLYFQCAISEAKEGGAVAYIVKKSDLQGIEDLQAPEIFADRKRGIRGVSPISRLRLRKFVHKAEDYDLAVPEDRVYGERFPGFVSQLSQWAMNSQQEKLQGQRPRMKDFVLMGGSYQDTSASTLFNKFFGDKLDTGEAEYGGEEETSRFDQYEEEVQAVLDEYQKKFKHVHIFASVEESEGMPYVYYSASLMFTVPYNLIKREIPQDWEFQKQILNWAKDNDIYTVDNVNFDTHNGDERIMLNIRDESGDGPDGFRSFVEHECKEWEEKFQEIEHSFYDFLVSAGYAEPNLVNQYASDVNATEAEFPLQHFTWDWDQGLTISLKQTIPLGKMEMSPETMKAGLWQTQGYFTNLQATFQEKLLKSLNQWAEQVLAKQKQQKTLFDYQPYKKPFSGEFKVVPYIRIAPTNVTYANGLFYNLEMTLKFETFQEDEHVHDALEFIKFLDTNFSQFVNMVKGLFAQIYR